MAKEIQQYLDECICLSISNKDKKILEEEKKLIKIQFKEYDMEEKVDAEEEVYPF